MKPLTRLIIGLTIAGILGLLWGAFSSYILNPPISFINSFLGGVIIGVTYSHFEFETIDRVFYD